MTDPHGLLRHAYLAAVAAAEPGAAVTRALGAEAPPAGRVFIVALGKASEAMALAAITWLADHGVEPSGGFLVAPEAVRPPHPALVATVGDHPVPGARSEESARRLGTALPALHPTDEVWVLLSGGTSSLLGGPVEGVTATELATINRLLLASGLDIHDMNTVRKRFSRWGAGRLAQALAPARVRCLALSDVPGDHASSIGSGPCVPDAIVAAEVLTLLEQCGLHAHFPPRALELLSRQMHGLARETPKPADEAFRHTTMRIVAHNYDALQGGATVLSAAGIPADIAPMQLTGEAAVEGRRLAERLAEAVGPRAFLWGGETSVTLPREGHHGHGGRNQEMALSAAARLQHEAPRGLYLLAAGTDGRDGPTDAAGGIVDTSSWQRLLNAGADPTAALSDHDAYRALDQINALIRVGPTGTNVMDIAIGLAL